MAKLDDGGEGIPFKLGIFYWWFAVSILRQTWQTDHRQSDPIVSQWGKWLYGKEFVEAVVEIGVEVEMNDEVEEPQ